MGHVSFTSKVNFGLYQGWQIASRVIYKNAFFILSVIPLCQVQDRFKSFLVIAKEFFLGTILQDGFGIFFRSSSSAFRGCG